MFDANIFLPSVQLVRHQYPFGAYQTVTLHSSRQHMLCCVPSTFHGNLVNCEHQFKVLSKTSVLLNLDSYLTDCQVNFL